MATWEQQSAIGRVVFRFAVGGLAILMYVGLVVISIIVPRTRVMEGTYAEYQGTVGQQPTLLRLRYDESPLSGEVELAGEPSFRLSLLNRSNDVFAFSVSRYERSPSESREVSYGHLTAVVERDQQGLHGIWQQDDRDVPKAFKFQRIVNGSTLRRTAGVFVGNRGRQIVYRGDLPRFSSRGAFHEAVERILRSHVEQAASESAYQPWDSLEDFWWTVSEGSCTNQWEFDDRWQITLKSDRLISLLCEHSEYTGGVHPNSHFDRFVFWWDGHSAIQLKLEDFFLRYSDWKQTLIDHCLCELEGLEASWPSYLDDYPEMLDVFTIHPNGFHFHFAPYAVGSYAEGSYTVTIPFEALDEFLQPDGPAAALPRSSRLR